MDEATATPLQRTARRYLGVAYRCRSELQLLTDLTTKVFAVPTAFVALVDDDWQHSVAATGTSPETIPRSAALSALVLDEPGVVSVPDLTRDPRFAHHPHVDGRRGALRFHASAPLRFDDGPPAGRLCVDDSTPRRTTENEELMLMLLARQVVDVLEAARRAEELATDNAVLIADRRELERSNQQLTEFAGQVSHDLRAPLSAIMASTELLLEEPGVSGRPAASHLVEGTLRAVNRMTGLLNDSLAYATLGARLHKERVDVRPLVEGVLDDLTPLITNSRAEVTLGELPVVHADSAHLYAVFLNLVTNAVKYARPGVPSRVVVDGEQAGNYMRLRVCDNGVGVPEGRRNEIFELYERIDGQAAAGFGIGLATVKRIVRAHGGRVGVLDNTGGGTIMWFELPHAG